MTIHRTRSIAATSLLALLAACAASPQASPESVPPPTNGASSEPSAQTSAEPTASASPSASPSEAPESVTIDGLMQTVVDRLRIRAEPGLSAASLGTLAEGATSYVVDGPVAVDGHDWYLLLAQPAGPPSGCITPVNTDPYDCPAWFGWAAAGGPDGEVWLAPQALDCPAWPADTLTADLIDVRHPMTYLSCFGDERRSIVGYFPDFPEEGGLGGACAVPEEMYWIGCVLGYWFITVDPELGYFAPGFGFVVHPEAVPPMPERGQWVEITGRFDHPAAQQCTYGESPERNVLACRWQFAVEEAIPVASP